MVDRQFRYARTCLLGPEAFDGQLAERLGERVITGMGEWLSPEVMEDQRHYHSINIVAEAKAEVGDVIDRLTFAYVVDEQVRESQVLISMN